MHIEDEATSPTLAPVDPAHSPDLLLYDLSKYLLTLCLLVLGGVLTVTGTADETAPPATLLVIIASLAISGFLSISCISTIVKARYALRPAPRYVRTINGLALAFLGAGVGAFLVIWVNQLI
jgi:hypothetical protein